MKRNTKFILLAIAALIFTLLAASCSSPSAEGISVDGDSFQTVYVKGQDLKLGEGLLHVDTGKKVEIIPLDSKGVTVSGYDKDTLGKQTVKIEYGGAATEVTVTVAERVAVNGAVTDYLVGDSLDKSRGVVKITEYDGTTRTLQLSSNSVSVSGFDSSTANDALTLTVTYKKGEESCEGILEVKVHEIEAIDFFRPNKITYGSHYEGAPDASGGRFVIKGGNGKIRREVTITSDMISGLDLSLVSAEKKSATQNLTVTYNGTPYTYEVELIYTDISLFKDNSEAFNSVNWNGESEPVIEKELGELALTLMTAYFDMPASERAYLDENTVFNVARTAMLYGFELWGDNIREFKGVFAIEYGERVLYLESYDRVEASLSLFDDKDSAIYSVAPLLLKLIEEYSDRVIYENETTRIRFNSYPVMDNVELAAMEAMLRHTLSVYDLVKNVPDGWRAEGLAAHHDNLKQAILEIFAKGYVIEYPDIYYLVSEWREGDDLFDMLYEYLYEADEKNSMKSLMLYGLSTNVELFYSHALTALLELDNFTNPDKITTLDTTRLLYNYYRAKESAARIMSAEGTAENYFFNNIPANLLFGVTAPVSVSFEDVLDELRVGVLGITSGISESAAEGAVIEKYLNLIHNSIEIGGYEDTAEYKAAIIDLFDSFIALTPTEQHNLISSLNFLYKELGIPALTFDDNDSNSAYSSLFSVLINKFMKEQLGEEASVYENLIVAIEIYANRFEYTGWQEEFTLRIDKVIDGKKHLSPEAEEFFNSHFSIAYTKYADIRFALGKTSELGQWEATFNEMRLALKDLQTAVYLVESGATSNYNYLFASYEKALEIKKIILSPSTPDDVVYAYYHEALFEAYGEDTGAAVYWSLDYALNKYRTGAYIDALISFGAESVNIYDAYYGCGLDKFLSLYYGMVSPFLNKTEGETDVFDKDTVIGVLEAFKALDSGAKALFYTLEGGVDMYGAALKLFITEEFTDAAGAVALKLFELEAAFYNYEVSGSGVTLASIRELLPLLQQMYSALSGADEASFSPLVNIYSFYIDKCENLPKE